MGRPVSPARPSNSRGVDVFSNRVATSFLAARVQDFACIVPPRATNAKPCGRPTIRGFQARGPGHQLATNRHAPREPVRPSPTTLLLPGRPGGFPRGNACERRGGQACYIGSGMPTGRTGQVLRPEWSCGPYAGMSPGRFSVDPRSAPGGGEVPNSIPTT